MSTLGNINEKALEILDFAQKCQRPDGSIYGTAGKCRKGTPVNGGGKEEKKSRAVPKKPTDFEKGGTLTKGDASVLGGEALGFLQKQISNAKEAVKKYPDDDFLKDRVSDLERKMIPFENNEKLLKGIVANVPKGTEVKIGVKGNIMTKFTTAEGNEIITTFRSRSFNFMVNKKFDAGSVTQGRAEEMAVARQVQRVFNAHKNNLPENLVIQTSAYADDGRGASRQRAYERMGFSKAKPGESIYGRVEKGKIVPSNQSEESLGSTLLTFGERKEEEDVALWFVAIFGVTKK